MARIGFYHLVRQPLEQVLPKLLEKALDSGARAVVLVGSEERLRFLDERLWTYRDDSWLPHGGRAAGDPVLQPVYLTTTEENPNDATILVACDGAQPHSLEGWARCLDLFDGNDPDAVEAARRRWKAWKDQGHELIYYQQGENGGWQEKAKT